MAISFENMFVNRSKNPNVIPDFEKGVDIALRDIKCGEELLILGTIKEDLDTFLSITQRWNFTPFYRQKIKI